MKLVLTTLFAILATTATAQAAGDAAAGKTKAAVCAACHGINGVGIAPTFPNLSGQKEAYLVAQLMAFKSGERKGANSATMAPMAAGLSEQDMMDLAAYFSSLDPSN